MMSTILQNKHRKANIATLPFHIRNNFRRLPNIFFQLQDVILPDNDSIETILQDFEDGNINKKEHNKDGNDHDYLEQRESDYLMFSESDYLVSSESDEDYATSSLDDADISSEERLFIDAALTEDKLPSFDGVSHHVSKI
ncbi:hypothetical protein GLOIN_2v1790377 [Rhizophagus clarus]|uniref:Uncharacterized protein n=1 Tax=Rhizophagus clarus TaxID=94130 RepID=A0A8H3L2H8_9GLOM|nr:hypothetical protein GLOIN_2v1790377 [Rhizophagus clarus]